MEEETEITDEFHINFLSMYLPPNISEKSTICMQKVDELRHLLLTNERTISLLPLLSAPSYPSGIIPEKADILNSIMIPTIMQTKDVTPSFVQHASLFVNFIYSKPDLFAKIVCKRYGQQDFHFMVYSVVPSFFGFFMSEEHISAATCFYQHIVNIAPPQIASAVLQPFFCSICSFRFLEGVMGPFCSKFGGELRLEDPKRQKLLIPQFANDLMDLIKTNVNLLPSTILILFNIMATVKNWNLRSLIAMFFDHFFNQLSIAWVASSPFSHKVPIFQKILKAATDDVKHTRDVLRTFVKASSAFEIPSAYRAFNEDYMQVLISIADIMCAAKCYEIENELP